LLLHLAHHHTLQRRRNRLGTGSKQGRNDTGSTYFVQAWRFHAVGFAWAQFPSRETQKRCVCRCYRRHFRLLGTLRIPKSDRLSLSAFPKELGLCCSKPDPLFRSDDLLHLSASSGRLYSFPPQGVITACLAYLACVPSRSEAMRRPRPYIASLTNERLATLPFDMSATLGAAHLNVL
jgi:hypothetical protein